MKVYLHFEEADFPSYSQSVIIDEKISTIKGIVEDFSRAYNIANSNFPLCASDLELHKSDGRKMDSLLTGVSNKDDINVRRVVLKKGAKSGSANLAEVAQVRPKNSAEMVTVRAEIEALLLERKYQKARVLSEKSLVNFPQESHIFYGAIAHIKLANENYDAAIKYASLAVTASAKVAADASIYNFTLAKALYLSGDRCDDADEVLEKMLAKKIPSIHPVQFSLDLRVLRAECLFDMNQHEAAANMLNEHMHTTGAEQHLPTLLAYARFSMAYRKVEEPIRAMLKAVVLDQKNARCRSMLAELLSTDVGYAELMKQVPLTLTSAAAYAYLATAVKECSAMRPCIRLFSDALKYKHNSPSFALNLSHAHEIICEFEESLDVIKKFCMSNLSMKVGNNGFCGADLLSALTSTTSSTIDPASPTHSATDRPTLPESSTAIKPTRIYDFSEFKCDKNDKNSMNYPNKEQYSKDDLDFLALAFAAVKISYLRGDLRMLPSLHVLIEPTRSASSELLHLTSIRNESAYYRCIIAVLAERGVIIENSPQPCVGTSEETQSTRTRTDTDSSPKGTSALSKQQDNKSDNKLSVALCGDFRSTKLSLDPKILLEASKNPIYICGDSHCLSLAWSVIYQDCDKKSVSVPSAPEGEKGVGKTPRLFVPRLVTGIKQWHLRPKGVFYPKTGFQHTIENTPAGADVVFLIGEIDCREGLLLAFERDHYTSLKEGMERTIDVFVAALVKIIAKKKFNVFIHPVAPVLSETRSLVKQFNVIYRQKVEKLKGVTWLDIFSDLLTENGEDLNTRYDLDGTHLSPSYVTLLEAAFQKHYDTTK